MYSTAAQVELVDIFKAVSRWPFPHFPAWWPWMTRLNGGPWRGFYQLTNTPRWAATFSGLLWPYVKAPLQELLHQHPAELLVSFHPVPNYCLARARDSLRMKTALMSVAQDLVSVHAATFAPGYEIYTVPTAEARARAIKCGAEAQRVQLTGAPIRRSFVVVRELSQQQARLRLALPPKKETVLFLGNNYGDETLPAIIQQVARRRPHAHLIALTGHNRQLRRRLEDLTLPAPLQLRDFVPEMAHWMRAADLIVTKAGPNTLAEVFVMGRPVILYAAIPGQETGNVRYTVQHGAGCWTPRPAEAASVIVQLLADPVRRQEMGRRA
ncbi:MAG: glycosyltransferase, partial [Anaerolineae bacterium]|nr:glycosyltransferase [Anaerolineae bacterium]